jgi:hypothetical protein
MAEARPYRIFLSGNCQMQFLYDALRRLHRGDAGIEFSFRASYRTPRAGDEAAAKACDVHVMQVTNLADDPWRDAVPALARRIRVPALALPGVFHAFAPRVHPDHAPGGRPPYYLARGNRPLNALAARHRGGEAAAKLVADYLDYRGAEIENAPRLMEMNRIAMRRIGLNADFDPWRRIEPHLGERRHFWSVKHPTVATATLLLRGAIEMLGLPRDEAALSAIAQGPEYHEPYHAPIHPCLAERLDLAWAGPDTRYRFFHRYFTAAEHAQRYIAGDFRRDFELNEAINAARSGTASEAVASRFRASLSWFPSHGQADFWYGRVLHRQGKLGLAAYHYRRARDGAHRAPHPVPHRADASAAAIEVWLRRCRKILAPPPGVVTAMKARLARLEAEEARLMAQIRRLDARRRLAALRAAEDAPP